MPDPSHSECPVCLSNSGNARISPGQPIFDGEHWVVEHAYPTSLLGWCVIVLKRHAESLHSLTRSESAELGALQWAVSKLLHAETDCLKEYSVFFAEMPRFSHLHFHMIPRSSDLDPELRGGKIFAFLKVDEDDAVPESEVAAFCSRARGMLSEILSAQDHAF